MAILTSSRFPLFILATMGLLAILGPDISANAAPQPYHSAGDIEARDISLDTMDALSKRDPEPDLVDMPQVNFAREEKRDGKHGKKGGHGKKEGGRKNRHKSHKNTTKGGKKKGGKSHKGGKKGRKKGHKREDESSLQHHLHRLREEHFLDDLD